MRNVYEWCRRVLKVHTTDVAVEDIPELRPWLHTLLETRLNPLLAACYPLLADGSTCGEKGNRLRVHDAFIVRYSSLFLFFSFFLLSFFYRRVT